MKFLFTSQPVPAHIEAMVRVARALAAAGHEVAFASAASVCDTLARAGVRAHAAGLDWSGTDPDRSFPQLQGRSSDERRVWFMGGLFAGIAAHRMVPDLTALCNAWRPDVIVRNDFEFAGTLVAERLRLPHATIGVDLGITPPYLCNMVGRSLAYLRDVLRLPRDPDCSAPYGFTYLSLLPPMCQFPEFLQLPWVRPIRVTTPAASTADRRAEPGRVHIVSLSFDASVPAATRIVDLVRDAVQPLATCVASSAESCCAITDGNLMSVLEAVSCGVPVIVVPTCATLPFHLAQWSALGIVQLVRCGFTQNARADAMFADALRRSLDAAITNPQYRGSAGRCAAQIATLPGIEAATRLLGDITASLSAHSQEVHA